jgi:hypothetical protein
MRAIEVSKESNEYRYEAPLLINCENLSKLSRRAKVPSYSRDELISRIVHFGVGGFNRSHLAVYLDDLLHLPGESQWGEYGIGLLPGDLKINQALASQNFLYSVLSRDADRFVDRAHVRTDRARRGFETTKCAGVRDCLDDRHRRWIFHRRRHGPIPQ